MLASEFTRKISGRWTGIFHAVLHATPLPSPPEYGTVNSPRNEARLPRKDDAPG